MPAGQPHVYGGAAMNQGIRNADCTLFHKEWNEEARRDVWNCMQLPGVSWYSKKGISVGTTGETAEDTVVIRVYTQQALTVDTGDIITPGLVTAQINSSADILRQFPDSVKVMRVRDNRRGSPQMRHWRIEGE